MTELTGKKCVPCRGGVLPLSLEEVERLLKKIDSWELHAEPPMRIAREFGFRDFREAIAFVNRVADLCEAEGHHANIRILYNRVLLEIYTHKIGGLHENDFILAAKVDAL